MFQLTQDIKATTSISSCCRKHEASEKGSFYEQRTHEMEHPFFTPLQFSAIEEWPRSPQTSTKLRLCPLLSDKREHPYILQLFLGCILTLSFSLLHPVKVHPSICLHQHSGILVPLLKFQTFLIVPVACFHLYFLKLECTVV